MTYDDTGSGVDTSSLAFMVDGSPVQADCTSSDLGSSCTLASPLSEGANGVLVTVRDFEGNLSSHCEVELVVDTVPPEISLHSPPDGLITNQPAQTFTGCLSESATLSINGETLSVDEENGFSKTVILQEGQSTFQFVAEDRAGNTGQAAIHLTLDTVAPAPVIMGLVTVSDVQDGQVTVAGEQGSVEAGARVLVKNLRTGETVVAVAGADGSFTVLIGAQAGDSLAIIAADGAGNESGSISIHVGTELPPAAAEIPEGSFGDMYRDLVPRDAALEKYDPKRFSLVTGSVITMGGAG